MDELLPEFISRQAKRLNNAGIEQAAAEVEWILCYVTDLNRLNLYLHGHRMLTDARLTQVDKIITRRIEREPLQYILEESWFYGRKFFVTPAVMAPTPETELLCETALRFLKNSNIQNPRVLDIGVGSGVIALTLALELPTCQITGIDISEEALNIARKNAADLQSGVNDFRQSDFFSAIEANEKFDLIASNPPYIAESDYADLSPEVKADPRVAMTSGIEGLDAIKAIIADAPNHLTKDGRLIFEIGYQQGEKVAALTANDDRYKSISILKDLNDIDRVVMLACGE